MAMNIDSLERTLKRAFGGKMRYQLDRESELIEMHLSGFKNFRDPEGEDGMRLLVRLANEGQYLEVIAPSLYDASGCQHMESLCRVLLGTSFRTPVVQFSLDESDGEIRATAEMVLLDGTCTPKQLEATISIVTEVIDKFHEHIELAMESGDITFPDEGAVVRPSLAQSRAEAAPLAPIDVTEAVRAALENSRLKGRKLWESAAPPKDIGRRM